MENERKEIRLTRKDLSVHFGVVTALSCGVSMYMGYSTFGNGFFSEHFGGMLTSLAISCVIPLALAAVHRWLYRIKKTKSLVWHILLTIYQLLYAPSLIVTGLLIEDTVMDRTEIIYVAFPVLLIVSLVLGMLIAENPEEERK